jgi:hypothetical protein
LGKCAKLACLREFTWRLSLCVDYVGLCVVFVDVITSSIRFVDSSQNQKQWRLNKSSTFPISEVDRLGSSSIIHLFSIGKFYVLFVYVVRKNFFFLQLYFYNKQSTEMCFFMT